MTLMKVSSQDVFEIKCRTEDGLLKTVYCHGLEHAREVGKNALEESNLDLSIDYYTNILIDSPDRVRSGPRTEHFGNIHFDLSELLSATEAVLAESRRKAAEEIDNCMAQMHKAISADDPVLSTSKISAVKTFRTTTG